MRNGPWPTWRLHLPCSAALLIDAFAWPHEVLRVSTIVMVLALPIVMILAWYHGVRALKLILAETIT